MIKPDSPEFVASFARGISVIRSFTADAPRQTLTEVAERSGMTRAAARRFLLTLEAMGYARSDGKYFELTAAVMEIGYAYFAALSVWEAIQPYLAEVTAALNESCSAAVLDGQDVVYVARSATNRRILSVRVDIGTRLPAHATSMGQVLLAGLAPPALARYLEAANLERFTDKTLTSVGALMKRLDLVRDQGFAIADEELEGGLRSIAVPVHDRNGAIDAALNISAHAAQVDPETLRSKFLPVLTEAAARADRARLLRL
jgi:IclR family pca regulon transcriptional regulator